MVHHFLECLLLQKKQIGLFDLGQALRSKKILAVMNPTTVHCVSSAKDSNSADEKAIKESSSIASAKKGENPYLGN